VPHSSIRKAAEWMEFERMAEETWSLALASLAGGLLET
jgi:hypothetical protein